MITVHGFENKFWTFPGGERSVKLTPHGTTPGRPIGMRMEFQSSHDLVDMILATNALRHMYGTRAAIELTVPYFPFGRQDRVMTAGESFGLQAAVDMIRMCGFDRVITWDIHSDVAGAMFPAGVFHNVSQADLWADPIRALASPAQRSVIISPDAGALKKIYKVAQAAGVDVIEANKVRDVATGDIVSTQIDGTQLHSVHNAIVVDDICDGGRTFIELARAIRARDGFRGQLILCVTHGIFSKGLDVLGGPHGFDAVYTANNINRVDTDAFNRRS